MKESHKLLVVRQLVNVGSVLLDHCGHFQCLLVPFVVYEKVDTAWLLCVYACPPVHCVCPLTISSPIL
jgi:hypothetical protein